MDIFKNFDLLSVGIAVASTAVLGFTVYFNNPKSVTNKTFLAFSIVTFLWGIVNYFFYRVTDVRIAFFLLKSVLFLASWQAFFLFQFFYVIPREKVIFSGWYKFILFPLLILTSILTFTPFALSEITEILNGRIIKVSNGPAMILFGIVSVTLVFAGIYLLLKKIRNSKKEQKKSFRIILLGALIMFTLIIIFNLIFPTLYNNSSFVDLGAIFVLPFIAFTFYAIFKHKLFNIKVAATALLVFALSIITFLEIILTEFTLHNLYVLILRISVFVLVLIFGILLIKGVLREVYLREQLQEANAQQERLIHFITHQIKGFFTVSRNIFAEVLGGDYGQLPPEIKPLIEKGLSSDTEGVRMVQDILNAANIKTGKLKYDMKSFDLKLLVEKIVATHRKDAVVKNLDYQVKMNEDNFQIDGDIMQLEHALGNLVDNAIKYTPSGLVKVSLKRKNGKVVYSVKDSGIGILQEDMPKIFTEGGRGKNAKKVNVQSTGYGLFIAKQIVEAHKGQISLSSEGEGKGTTFIVELPTS